MFKIAVFISGTGSNLQSIIEKQAKYPYQVSLVFCNNEQAKGLEIARTYDIPTYIFKWDKDDVNLTKIHNRIRQANCQLIVLAGFMKILPKGFIESFKNQIINIHPSLLPKYPGLHTHQQVLDNGDKVHGATVHYVNAQLDAGKIISQSRIEILDDDNKDTLAARLLFREHSLLPHTISIIAQNRVKWHENELYFDHKILTQPIELND
ncbi:MAG: phosphoribosylglycinamide formyltransferase [Proteobacteria bacterium]|nr:phosphoribosylglycinamide formyltransferase [Pseudomonadota bacterium]